MRAAHAAVALFFAATAAAACNAIFGIDSPESTATATTSSAASSTTASSSGAGGGGPGDVVLIDPGSYGFIDPNTGNPTSATLTRAFEVDRFEVTVARFKAWVEAKSPAPCSSGTCDLDPSGPYAGALTWDSAWNTNLSAPTYVGAGCNAPATGSNLGPTYPGMMARVPVTCVNWFQAAAFCFFEQKRLLTETEWRFAATSRGTSSAYPWGTDPPGLLCDHAIFSVSPGANDCHFPRDVGSAPKGGSAQGVFDLSGSVFEWGWDFVTPYPTSPTTDYAGGSGEIDDAGNVPGRTAMGGSFATVDSTLNVFDRPSAPPDSAYADIGFRCGRSK